MVVRGCGGSRVAGGVYIMVNTSPFGMPLEYFLVDPPIVIEDPALAGISSRGMSYTPSMPNQPWDVVDWVGGEFYPNVTDILAEIRAYGLSRRVQSTLDFSLLGEKSRIHLMHSRAHITQGRSLLWAGAPLVKQCPRPDNEHSIDTAMASMIGENDETPMCARLWWEAVAGTPIARVVEGSGPDPDQRLRMWQVGDVSYMARVPPEGVELRYQPAIFASFPISHIEVVRDPVGGTHEKALRKARKAGLAVEDVDE